MYDDGSTVRAPEPAGARPAPPPPPDPAAPPAPPISEPARATAEPFRRSQLVAAAVAAASVELARHSGPSSIGAALAVSAMATVLLALRRRPADWACALAVAALGAAVVITSAPWLIAVDLTMAIAALALLAGRRPGAALTTAQVVGGLRALPGHVPGAASGAARQAAGALPAFDAERRGQIRNLARSVLVALPLVGAVAVLVATADGLVRSWLDLPDLGPGPMVGVLTMGAGAWAALTLARAQLSPAPPTSWRWWRPSSLDAVVTMAGVAVVLAGYSMVRLSAALAGDGYIQRRTGLTYAQYARAGFFQLLGAAGLALVAIVVTRTAPPGRWVRGLRLATAVTVLALVGCTAHGFVLYQDAYGLTRLRIVCLAVLLWIIVAVLVVMAGEASSRLRAHSTAGAGAAGVLVVLGLHLVNPDLLIARTNLALAERTGRLDLEYLTHLSPDAAPALDRAAEVLDGVEYALVRQAWCTNGRQGLAWNLSAARADARPECH